MPKTYASNKERGLQEKVVASNPINVSGCSLIVIRLLRPFEGIGSIRPPGTIAGFSRRH